MRLSPLAVALSASVLALAAAPAVAAPAQPPVMVQAEISDAELAQFAQSMQSIQAVMAQVEGGAPTEAQPAEMAAAVEAAGLDITRFNAISQAVSTDEVTRARIEVATAPESPAGSLGAEIGDAELAQYARAELGARAAAAAGGEDQTTRMAQAVTDAGLDLERFNAISAATSTDPRLSARIAVERARAGG